MTNYFLIEMKSHFTGRQRREQVFFFVLAFFLERAAEKTPNEFLKTRG